MNYTNLIVDRIEWPRTPPPVAARLVERGLVIPELNQIAKHGRPELVARADAGAQELRDRLGAGQVGSGEEPGRRDLELDVRKVRKERRAAPHPEYPPKGDPLAQESISNERVVVLQELANEQLLILGDLEVRGSADAMSPGELPVPSIDIGRENEFVGGRGSVKNLPAAAAPGGRVDRPDVKGIDLLLDSLERAPRSHRAVEPGLDKKRLADLVPDKPERIRGGVLHRANAIRPSRVEQGAHAQCVEIFFDRYRRHHALAGRGIADHAPRRLHARIRDEW